jgi:hypothetical protein
MWTACVVASCKGCAACLAGVPHLSGIGPWYKVPALTIAAYFFKVPRKVAKAGMPHPVSAEGRSRHPMTMLSTLMLEGAVCAPTLRRCCS